ncbi:MAG: ATP-dependent RNA helicase DbpA [Gammaproteobacteria bacterium]
MSSTQFSNLPLGEAMLSNLDTLGYHEMSEVQAQSLPFVLEGKDVIAEAMTGSGKTAAFGLGLLHHLEPKKFRIQALVLCPTRELADQVAKELRRLARCLPNVKVLTLCGGVPLGPQIGSLEHGAHIIVGTPGRVAAHIRKKTVKFDHVSRLVLDEADRMLDMGFQDEVDRIIEALPEKRQTLLFSATYPETIQKVARRIMRDPTVIKVEQAHDETSIRQYFHAFDEKTPRITALKLMLLKHAPERALVFCNTRIESREVAEELRVAGFIALALHGELEQKERDQTLVLFSNKSVSVLVATDVAARGIDIQDLDLVVNFHLANDMEVHVHRVGRTGRAGSQGVACTLFENKEQYKLNKLAEFLERDLPATPLPSLQMLNQPPVLPPMSTLRIEGGRKQKVRPGDILGALTGNGGISAGQVGKIDLFDNHAFVAVQQSAAKPALRKLQSGKLKGRSFRVRRVHS